MEIKWKTVPKQKFVYISREILYFYQFFRADGNRKVEIKQSLGVNSFSRLRTTY